MKRLIFIAFLTISCAQAQHQLSGSVLTSGNDPVEFATVVVYPMNDATNLKGIITDSQGTFSFTDLSSGRYGLTVQMLGYEDWTGEIELVENTDLGSIIISEEIEQLGVVEVVAEQSSIESHLGKKVLRIGKDLSSTGSNALEALETIPSVTTTPRGQVQIRGNSDVIIYINGKETKRDPSTLKFITAESLEKIEIVTNPSAQYDAEGVGGIINIVYKKDRNSSFKLELTPSVAILTNPLYLSPNVGVNFGWTKRRFSLFANLSHDYGRYEDNVDAKRVNYTDSLQHYENQIITTGLGNISNALVGFSVEPDSTSSIGVEINYTRWDILDELNQRSLFEYTNSDSQLIAIRSDRGEIENELWVSLAYEKELKNQGTLNMSFVTGGENEANFTKGEDLDLSNLPSNAQQFIQLSDELENQRYYHGKADFEMPVKKWGTIQTGIKADLVRYDLSQIIILQSDTIQLPDNDFNMDLQKLGVYVIQKKKFNSFECAVGLRLEQFTSDAFQASNQMSFTQKNTGLFPSLQLNYLIDDYDHSLGLNYTRRINRPGFFDLNPYVSYQDPLNLETGNPALEPEIAHLLEVNYHKEWKKANLNLDLTLYNRKTMHSIQRIIEPIDDNRTLTSRVNFGQENSRGIELHLEYKPSTLFKTSGAFVLTQNRYEDTDGEVHFNNQSTWSLQLRQELKLNGGWKIEFSEIYRAPSYQVQQKTHKNYYMNVGIGKKLNNKKGSISLAVRDLFNTREYRTSLHTASFNVERRYKWQTRQITLGIKYNIFDVKN